MLVFSFRDTNQISSIPRLTGHAQRWHTLMALPGHNQLARRDLYGLRPTPLCGPNKILPRSMAGQENEHEVGDDDTNTDDLENTHIDLQRSPLQHQMHRRPLVPNSKGPAPRRGAAVDAGINNHLHSHQAHHLGHEPTTLQSRMATAAEAAAARARISRRH